MVVGLGVGGFEGFNLVLTEFRCEVVIGIVAG